MEFFTQGFLLQASLILALGAQNLFLIDIGTKKKNHYLAAAICSVCDMALILLAVLGVSGMLVKTVEFKVGIGLLGASFLLYYAVMKLIDSVKGVKETQESKKFALSRRIVILTTLSFTLLNPHVYIDAFFLIGGYSTRFDLVQHRFLFGLGAGVFSIVWFYFLVTFSSKFSHILTKEKNLRISSLATAIVLGYLAHKLGTESVTEFIQLMS
ncbi:LysE family transporter [Halobacteriovorax sp. HFRX-2_2]|uniref:LysE/ArgO family amino acid transporter n=1 Tax=unclassified Halobacteriovorax TaxID=2639665 RepID=UPI003716CA1D